MESARPAETETSALEPRGYFTAIDGALAGLIALATVCAALLAGGLPA